MDAVGPLSDDGLVRLLTHEGERVEFEVKTSERGAEAAHVTKVF